MRWLVPVVLAVLSIALITLCVRMDGGGAFSVVRSGVQSVTQPLEAAVATVPNPLKSIGQPSEDDKTAQLELENSQLKTLVSQLEEYRQQDQRLTSLLKLSDTYGLASVSANVTGITRGWNQTATINKGSSQGIRVGMGVISSCGMYGQVESVTSSTSTVRLMTDANSSVGAMIQGSRARGILSGSYDGTLTLNYVDISYTVGEGDIVISSGAGGTYPQGIIIGTVRNVEPDSSKLYYRITVDPIYPISSCQEVLVLTGDEDAVATLVDETLLDSIVTSMTSISTGSSTANSSAAPSSSASTSAQSQGTTSAQTQSSAGSSQQTNQSGQQSGQSNTSASSGSASSGSNGAASAASTNRGTAGE